MGTLRNAAALACVVAISATPALAQTYPAKTVRVIVPTGPSGGADLQARLMSKRLGYTLLVASSLIAVTAVLYKKLAFDPLKDLVPISQIASAPQALIVHRSVPAKSVRELVALAKAQPGKLNAGSSGSGSVNHIALEMLKQAGGLDISHIPYKSGAAAATAVMSGEVDFIFTGVVQALPTVRTGRARAIAVTSTKASDVLPDVPPLASVYPGYYSANWYGMFAPTGTPAAIVNRLHTEIVAALKAPEIRELITREGAEPVGSSPQDFAIYLRSEIERSGKVVRAGNIRLD